MTEKRNPILLLLRMSLIFVICVIGGVFVGTFVGFVSFYYFSLGALESLIEEWEVNKEL